VIGTGLGVKGSGAGKSLTLKNSLSWVAWVSSVKAKSAPGPTYKA
jgi:hypothetical protein